MFSLRNRFGIPGVISVIALVFAMLGGAYAASNNSGSGKATASAGKRGPRGPKGATGPAGPAGPQGPAGANGKDGTAGNAGTNGTNGAPGKSVAINSYTGPECPGSEEGASVEVTGEPTTKKYVCDGKEGERGPEGALGTAGGTLPQGATETGSWGISGQVVAFKDGEGNIVGTGFHMYYAPISFAVPLAEAPEVSKIKYAATEPDPAHCSGSAANPTAAEGYVCIYESERFHAVVQDFSPPAFAPSVAGLTIRFFPTSEPGYVQANGTWAVTGS